MSYVNSSRIWIYLTLLLCLYFIWGGLYSNYLLFSANPKKIPDFLVILATLPLYGGSPKAILSWDDLLEERLFLSENIFFAYFEKAVIVAEVSVAAIIFLFITASLIRDRKKQY